MTYFNLWPRPRFSQPLPPSFQSQKLSNPLPLLIIRIVSIFTKKKLLIRWRNTWTLPSVLHSKKGKVCPTLQVWLAYMNKFVGFMTDIKKGRWVICSYCMPMFSSKGRKQRSRFCDTESCSLLSLLFRIILADFGNTSGSLECLVLQLHYWAGPL